ncbi:TIGR02281 family clan AA aspartic protease [Sphingomicrobium sp. XHP0239]|uniref:retropepsin-like aspartic protease family protein n=1 Tax=Sphingomicrobium maritimum TaxID=3133972 RepID=UPI0031CCD14D
MKYFALMVVVFAALVAVMADPAAMEVAAADDRSAETLMVDAATAPIVAASAAPMPPVPTYSSAVEFERGPGGHFYTDAVIGGTSVRFLVDTGATGIALTEADARRLGLPFDPHEFHVVGRQVSGEVRGKPVTLTEVRVGGKVVRDIEATIIEGGTMNLLGQSFLTRAGRIEMDGDTMVLR